MPSQTKNKARPVSPHLQIYKPQLTSVLSVFHRVFGASLFWGAVVFVAWLIALAQGAESYALFLLCAKSIIGQLVLFGLSFSLCYHFCCGIRHLIFDACFCLDLKKVYATGYAVLAGSVLLTTAIWLKAYGVF